MIRGSGPQVSLKISVLQQQTARQLGQRFSFSINREVENEFLVSSFIRNPQLSINDNFKSYGLLKFTDIIGRDESLVPPGVRRSVQIFRISLGPILELKSLGCCRNL